MKRIPIPLAVALLAIGSQVLVAQAPTPATTRADETAPPAPVTVSPVAPPVAPTPVPTLVDDILKLWKANLSESFLKKYVATSDIVKELTAEDIVRLRSGGLPEDLILAISQRKAELAAAAAGPKPAPTPPTTARWEGLARRNDGLVLFKSRWEPGVLEFKDDTLRWTDARDPEKNRSLPAKSLTEQQLTCLKKPDGIECFEWVAKTRSAEYRFRNVAWEQNDNTRIQDVYSFLKTLYPNLVSSQVPVDRK